MVEPGAQQRQRLPRDAGRLRRGRNRQPERGGELRDVEDRRGRLADDERRDDRPSRLGPAPRALAAVPDVERLELDPLLAKELPGRRARRSGRLPEQRHSFHSAIIAAVKIAVVGAGAMGSVYAGLLGSAGNEVWAVDLWQEHIDAIREHGLRVEGASGDRVVRGPGDDGRGRGRRSGARDPRDQGDGRRGRGRGGATAGRAGHAGALDPERPRRPRPRRERPRRGQGGRRRRGRVRRLDRRTRARASPRLRAGPARRAPWPGDAADRGGRRRVARRGVHRSHVRRRRSGSSGRSSSATSRSAERAPCSGGRSGRCSAMRMRGRSPQAVPPRPSPSGAPPASASISTTRSPTCATSARRSRVRSRRCCSTSRRGRRLEIDFINGAIPRVGREVGVAAPVNETVTALVRALAP